MSALFEFFDDRTWAAIIALLLLALTFILTTYLKPHIGYWYDPGEDKLSHRFTLRNFESSNIEDPICFELEAAHGFREIEVFAGPWMQEKPSSSQDSNRTEAQQASGKSSETEIVSFTLKGFPAEGAIVVKASTLQPSNTPGIRISSGSKVQPRKFVAIEKFNGSTRIRNFFWRWAAGILSAIVVFSVGCRLLFNQWPRFTATMNWPSDIDMFFAIFMFCSSFVLFVLIVPVRGKETIGGYLGWHGTGYRLKGMSQDK